MPPAESRVALLEELRVARAGGDSDQLHTTLDRWSLRPLTGGRNNHVYVWDDPHRGPTCIKIYYRVDDRRRADREWSTLTLLAEHGVTDVPRPLWIDRNGAEPAIGMSLLDGVPLLQSPNLPAALKNMTHTVQRIQAVPPSGLLAELDRIDSIAHYAFRLTELWPGQLAEYPDDPLTADMRQLLAAWHGSGDRELIRQSAPYVLSRGDANLLNWLVLPSSSGCVDFEFSGRSTVAADAADQIEHISSRDVPDDVWYGLLGDLGVDRTNTPQFRAAQRTCALRWLAVLWKQRGRRAEEFTRQLERVRQLQSTESPWRL
ncbi:aminoglycoside phosphotransferase family protein [Dactylosporangium darangshiense]